MLTCWCGGSYASASLYYAGLWQVQVLVQNFTLQCFGGGNFSKKLFYAETYVLDILKSGFSAFKHSE